MSSLRIPIITTKTKRSPIAPLLAASTVVPTQVDTNRNTGNGSNGSDGNNGHSGSGGGGDLVHRAIVKAVYREDQSDVLGLSATQAQIALNEMWRLLEQPALAVSRPEAATGPNSPSNHFQSPASQILLRKLCLKLSLLHGKLPASFLLRGVECADRNGCGGGGFGDVYRGTYYLAPVALKTLRVYVTTTDSQKVKLKQAFYRESLLWKNLRHEHILPFWGVSEEVFSQAVCMVLPWMENGSIRSYIDSLQEQGKCLGAEFVECVARWLLQIALGLEYLHKVGLIHGDLHGGNILIDSSGGVRLTDFGMSLLAEATAYNYASIHGGGASRWKAPELIDPDVFGLKSSRPTCASDVYSFACVCIELFTGHPPFPEFTDFQVGLRVLNGTRPPRPTLSDGGVLMPDRTWGLTQSCWSHYAAERPTSRHVARVLGGKATAANTDDTSGEKQEGGTFSLVRIGAAASPVDAPGTEGSNGNGGKIVPQIDTDLVEYFERLSVGDYSRIKSLKSGGFEGGKKVATLLKRLNDCAKDSDFGVPDKAKEHLLKYTEKFEKSFLQKFDASYRNTDPRSIRSCADVLWELNGGASYIPLYVNQSEWFILAPKEVNRSPSRKIWREIPDPNTRPPYHESGLTDLFTKVQDTMESEVEITHVIFPNAPIVLQAFLRRLFAQSISNYIDQLLETGSSISDLAFLRLLKIVHQETVSLVDDLKKQVLRFMVSKASPLRSDSVDSSSTPTPGELALGSLAPGADSGLVSLLPPEVASVGAMLETATEELLFMHLEDYVGRESRSLTDLYAGLLARFRRHHEQARRVGKSNTFGWVVNQFNAAVSTSSAAAILRYGRPAAVESSSLPISSADKGNGEESPKEEDGELRVGVAEKMLEWHAEAIERCIELSPPGNVPQIAYALLRVLTTAIGGSYVELALETTQSRLDATNFKSSSPLTNLTPTLSLLRDTNEICRVWANR